MEKFLYKNYLKKRLNLIILLLICIFLGILVDSTNPYIFGKIIDSISKNEKNIVGKYLIYFAIILSVVQILAYIEKLLGRSVVLKTINEIKANLFCNVLNMPYNKIYKYGSGELLNRIEFDASIIVDYYIDLVSSLFMIVGNLLISLYFLFKISKVLSGVSFVLVCLMYVLNFIFKNKIAIIQNEIKRFSDRYYSWLQESISNVLGIKVFWQEHNVCNKYDEYLDKDYTLQMKNMNVETQIELGRGIISIFLDVLILYIATIYISNGKLTLGSLVAFNTYLSKLLTAISKILDININKQAVNVSYERILSMFKAEEKRGREVKIGNIENINFGDVYFRYGEKQVLNGVTFFLNEPGIYTFVGANGCGKTTIFSLIEKLYFAEYGEIKINGIKIEEIDTKCLRRKLLYLTKEPYLINGTILENLKIGNENVSIDIIQHVSKMIGIHNDIMKLEDQYNSRIDEAGKNFSSGQKQKLAFVRAYINNASMILLDEVTSDIDGRSEKDICELIKKMGEHSIVINISHRQLSIEMSRNVFYMEDGKIVDMGKHIELLNKNDKYKAFFK
ncbi:MAG: ABC transporter ATP-binding protein [Dorea sp.]|jgi:ABC-type bacteriocin/lantibiotic exporter with double-glycine peptidase domain|nr:ABC transporter ATP-binding protein [Dorea sp.]